ncbi:MAG TPA: hypothetical protein VGR21_03735 [Cryptosporangiaceae bacterium]|nr:hypothetical protein [Cryptosporangiaceae bacterium]
MEQDEQDTVLLIGWLSGEGYEAALAYRRADREHRDRSAATPAEHPTLVGRQVRGPRRP